MAPLPHMSWGIQHMMLNRVISFRRGVTGGEQRIRTATHVKQ
jgi:hypothetical protein